MILRWRSTPSPITVRWRMPGGLLDAVRQGSVKSVAGFLVPPANEVDPGDLAAVFNSA